MAISGRRRFGLVVVVAALAVAAVGVVAVRADPAPNLPPIAGDQLLTSTLAALARPFTISGEVHTRFDLGIPQIPSSVGGDAGGGALSALALATGDQRYKVWRSADGVRIAHLLDLSEQDLVVSTSDAWFWDSSDSKVAKTLSKNSPPTSLQLTNSSSFFWKAPPKPPKEPKIKKPGLNLDREQFVVINMSRRKTFIADAGCILSL